MKKMARVIVACAVLVMILTAQSSLAASKLAVVAESRSMIWNATVVDNGRIFVSGPRWTGATGPQLAVVNADREPLAYPDAKWNGWKPGNDPAEAFVNINALHRHDGSLYVVDTGSPDFGGNPLPAAAKIVRIDLASNRVTRVYPFGADVALPGSYIDDIRIRGTTGYLTDAGRPGLIVLDLATGAARRVLDGAASVTASDRPIVTDGAILNGPDGKPLKVHSDPLELSADGKYLYFAPLNGPWSRVETKWLNDPASDVASHVEPWADLPPVGGTTLAPNGDLFFTDLAENAVKRRNADGQIETLVQDERLHWADAPYLDERGELWLPVPQLDRTALFHAGISKIVWPVQLLRLSVKAGERS